MTARLFAPVDISSLAFFRVAFGGLMAFEVFRYLANGQFHEIWVAPEFHFKYLGFSWVAALPDRWMMTALWCLVGGAGIGVMLGMFYRTCATVLFLGWTYFFLVEQAKYMNHFYLICLLAFWCILLPCQRAFSIDSWRNPKIRCDFAPAWSLWALRFQLGVVYFYGGIAKLNADWLRHGEPVRTWMSERGDFPVIGPLLTAEATVWTIAYGGALFDLLVVPALLWRKTRAIAFVSAVGFHLANLILFNIGIFPWLAIALTALFFHPTWPRGVFARFFTASPPEPAISEAKTPRPQRAIICLLVAFAAWQLLMPLRHWLYPGNPSWTEEGHRFAWRMMLRSKLATSKFYVIDPQSDTTWQLEPIVYLRARQYRKMNGRPDMLLQFAHHIADLMRENGYPDVEVRAEVHVALNGRPPATLITTKTDLAARPRTLRHAQWILPLPPP